MNHKYERNDYVSVRVKITDHPLHKNDFYKGLIVDSNRKEENEIYFSESTIISKTKEPEQPIETGCYVTIRPELAWPSFVGKVFKVLVVAYGSLILDIPSLPRYDINSFVRVDPPKT